MQQYSFQERTNSNVTSGLLSGGFGSAFTIIELLIVIVIIGILVAIVAVSYNGIQTQAKMASYATTVRQWEDSIHMYEIKSGRSIIEAYREYAPGKATSVCLGDMSDYPANASKNYLEGNCYGGSSTPWSWAALPGFKTHIEETLQAKLPSLKTDIYGRNIRGLVLTDASMTNANSTEKGLLYWVPGDTCFGSDKPSNPFDGGIHCSRPL